jgi:hypothetical protein
MNESQPYRLAALVVAARIALGFLALLVLAGMVVLFPLSDEMAAAAPEFGNLKVPFLLAGLAIGACAEVAIVVTAILAGRTRGDEIFEAPALRLVDALVVAPAAATVITASLLPAVPGPPLLGYALLVCVLGGSALVLILLVLRALLRRAVSMHTELDEVV